MGLEEMLSRMHADTEQEYEKVVANARSEAAGILEVANQKAESVRSQGRVQAEKDVQEEKLRSVASARLEVKRQLMQAREDVLEDYERKAKVFVDEFVQSKDYDSFLMKLIDDGVEKIGDTPVVHVCSRDAALLRGRPTGFQVSDEPFDCKGGAIISSQDGKRRVDNTIESLLSERRDELRLKLAERVFGDKSKTSS